MSSARPAITLAAILVLAAPLSLAATCCCFDIDGDACEASSSAAGTNRCGAQPAPTSCCDEEAICDWQSPCECSVRPTTQDVVRIESVDRLPPNPDASSIANEDTLSIAPLTGQRSLNDRRPEPANRRQAALCVWRN